MTAGDMKAEVLKMLRQAIESVEDGTALYVILAVLGENDEDHMSVCAGQPEVAARAEAYLRDMVNDVAARPLGVRQ